MAIGPAGTVAIEIHRSLFGVRAGAAHSWTIGLPMADGAWPALEVALREYREERGARAGLLHLALLRPLGWSKLLHLPPLRAGDLRQLVEQSADRYFPVPPSSPALAGIALVPRTFRVRGSRRVFATAAPATLISAAQAAAGKAGFRLGNVSVGPAAAAAGLRFLGRSLGRGRCAVALATEDALEILCLDRGCLVLARALPLSTPADAGALLAGALDEIGRTYGYQPARVAVLAPEPLEAELRSGWPGEQVFPERRAFSLSALPALGAAAGASRAPVILTPQARARLARRLRLRSCVLAALTTVCLGAAAHLHLRDLHAQAEAVRERREQLRPAVQQALRARGEMSAVQASVVALDSMESSRARWLSLLGRITEALPREAHLSSLRVTGAEVRLEGRARSAAALVPVFEAASWVRSVRLGSPVRRERTPGGVFERFSITLEVLDRGRAPDARSAAEKRGVADSVRGSTPPSGRIALGAP